LHIPDTVLTGDRVQNAWGKKNKPCKNCKDDALACDYLAVYVPARE